MTDKFDWHKDEITPDTLIDSGYRNTQNVRRFFKDQSGIFPKFDRDFMAWMKASVGVSMGEAVAEFQRRLSAS